MTVPALTRTVDLQARKAQGRAYLSEDRIDDALRVYANILRENPQDIESYLFLGDFYLADGDGETAQLLYNQALSLSPESSEIRRRLQLALIQNQHTATLPRKPIPTDLQAIARLLQKLTGQSAPVTEDEIIHAGQLLEAIINSPHPAQMVAEHLEEISALIPALLELNIRQARVDGRPDLAQALQNLAENILLQMDTKPVLFFPGSCLGYQIDHQGWDPRVVSCPRY